MEHLTITELKKILRSNGLQVSGKKNELIKRLKDNRISVKKTPKKGSAKKAVKKTPKKGSAKKAEKKTPKKGSAKKAVKKTPKKGSAKKAEKRIIPWAEQYIESMKQKEKKDYEIKRKELENKQRLSVLLNSKVLSISGPNMIHFFKNINGKKILLFGENHSYTGMCMNCHTSEGCYYIQDYIERIIRSSNECIDIFIETKKANITRKIGISPLIDVRNRVLLLSKRDNIRYHVADVRIIGEHIDSILTYLHRNFAKFIHLSVKTQFDIQNHLREIYSYAICYTMDDTYYNEAIKIALQILKLTDVLEDFKFKGNRVFMDTFRKIIQKEFQKLSLDYDKFNNVLIDIYSKTGSELPGIINNLMNIPMDLYTLLRMFIQFSGNKMSRGPKLCQKYPTPKNIIFYGGSAVSNFSIYHKFL